MPKFEWRGKSLEEIEKMPLDEFSKLVPSRQRRTLKRGFTEIQKKFLKSLEDKKKKFYRTRSREMVIIPKLLGAKIGVYNGKEYVPVEIRPEMLGYRLGDFVPTCKMVKHSAPGFGATKSSKYVPLK